MSDKYDKCINVTGFLVEEKQSNETIKIIQENSEKGGWIYIVKESIIEQKNDTVHSTPKYILVKVCGL